MRRGGSLSFYRFPLLSRGAPLFNSLKGKIMSTKPRLVPVLEADDFVIGPYHDGCGRFCLLGWRTAVFGQCGQGSLVLGDAVEAIDPGRTITILDDRRKNTPRNRNLAVRVWDRFTLDMGYVENGPEEYLDVLRMQVR